MQQERAEFWSQPVERGQQCGSDQGCAQEDQRNAERNRPNQVLPRQRPERENRKDNKKRQAKNRSEVGLTG